MSLIAIWLISLNDNCIIYRRYFPINAIKANHELLKRPLTNAEEREFVDSLFTSLGLTLPKNVSSSDECFDNFDCTSINQLPAIGIEIKNVKIWPLIVIEHKKILFIALPLVKQSSDQLIDHISISQAMFILQNVITYFNITNRYNLLEEYFTTTMPFGSFITNPQLIVDDFKDKKLHSNSSKQDLLILIKINEFILSAKANNEIVFGTVLIENNITPNEKSVLQIQLDNINHLNLLLSPFIWLNSNNTMLNIKLNHKANKFFNYYIDMDKFKLKPFLSYDYKVIRKDEQFFNLDLSITIKMQANIKFEYINLYFINPKLKDLNTFSNCHLSQGQFQYDKNLGIVWSIGSKLIKTGQINLKCDVNCNREFDNFLDAKIKFKVNHYNHGLSKIKSEALNIKDCQISNFKLLTETTMSSYDYRILPTFQ